MAVSSAALSTDPSSASSILLIAIAAVHTESYIVEQYWSHTPLVRAPRLMASDSAPSMPLWLRCCSGSFSRWL
eukprot:1356160-Rhodomonas_salina.1